MAARPRPCRRRSGWHLATGLAACLGLGLALPAAQAAVATPGQAPTLEVGHYEARWCVSVAAQPAQCGAVQLSVLAADQWAVRVDDVRYRLQLRGQVLDAFVFHGPMQIDEFTAPLRWMGQTLEFLDEAKSTRFTLHLPAKAP